MSIVASHGYNTCARNARHHQPLHLAVLKGHISCARILIRHGARIDAVDEGGNTPLHAAVLAGNYECAQELVHYGVDVNSVNKDNGAAIHYASTVPLVSLLLDNGADPEIAIKEEGGKEKTAFNFFLEAMPEACNEILSKYLSSNGKSLGAVDLEIAFDYDLFLEEFNRTPAKGEIGLLSNICHVDQRSLLKHPVCESFLHMKWLLVKNVFTLYVMFYVIFLTCLTGYVFLEFSPYFEGKAH
jgi:hypothetical protein